MIETTIHSIKKNITKQVTVGNKVISITGIVISDMVTKTDDIKITTPRFGNKHKGGASNSFNPDEMEAISQLQEDVLVWAMKSREHQPNPSKQTSSSTQSKK